jgi:hypothetical protein
VSGVVSLPPDRSRDAPHNRPLPTNATTSKAGVTRASNRVSRIRVRRRHIAVGLGRYGSSRASRLTSDGRTVLLGRLDSKDRRSLPEQADSSLLDPDGVVSV